MQVFVPKPTLVQLPADVKRMVIVDKTQGKFLTAIEGILTSEMIGIDKILSQEFMTDYKIETFNMTFGQLATEGANRMNK